MTQEFNHNQGIDFTRLFRYFVRHWYVFVVFTSFAIFISKTYLQRQSNSYNLSTTLLIKDESENILLPQGITAISSTKTIENEIEIMKSCAMVEKAIEKLNFEVSYYVLSDKKLNELYTSSPFQILFDHDHKQFRNMDLYITFHEDLTFSLHFDEKSNIGNNFILDTWLENKNYRFLVRLKPGTNAYNIINKTFAFKLNDRNRIVSEYCNKLNVQIVPGTSILRISSTGPNIDKEKDFLNALANVYITSNLIRKNELSEKTISFINEQIANAKEELSRAETELENFRKENKLMKLTDKAKPILSRVNTLNKNKADQKLDLKYFEYLRDYIINNDDFEDFVSPATIGLTIPLFSKLLSELQELYLEKENLIVTSSMENPYIKDLEEKIANQKEVLLENISNTIKVSEMKIQDFDERITQHLKDFEALPKLERKYLEITRIFELNSELYTYFLKKRSEAEITKANNSTDLTLISQAGDVRSIGPGSKSTYIKSVVFALIAASSLLFLAFLIYRKKISYLADVKAITNTPIIGFIFRRKLKSHLYLLKKPYGRFAQSIKKIRSQIQLNNYNGTIIGVTSDEANAGKTFVSLNMALAFSLTGKKTVLVDFNLRKPDIAKIFNDYNNKGVSEYLNPATEKILNITHPEIDNLDVILSGSTKESVTDKLFYSNQLEDFFLNLRSLYQIIIVDTNSISKSSEPFELKNYFDSTLFIVRRRHTSIQDVSDTLQQIKENELLPDLKIIYNDIKGRRP